MTDPFRLITFRSFDSSAAAYVLKSKLESCDILCFVHDEHMVNLMPIYANAVGGVKLLVYENDLRKAEEIVSDIEALPHTNENNEIICCPECHAQEVAGPFRSMKSTTGFFAAILSLLVTSYPLYYFNVYRCKVCGCEFEEKEERQTAIQPL